MTSGSAKPGDGATPPRKEREWSPKFWDGMRFSAWIRLLARNGFRVGWQRWPLVALITALSLYQVVCRWWQWLWIGRHAAHTRIEQAPIFVIGHWRSGTTLLHELLVLDDRHAYPTTFECFAPNIFLMSEDFAIRWLGFLLPERRPMDNMAAGWERPQEDEFALCNLGLPSPYLTIAFPNEPPQYPEYLSLEDVPADGVEHWKQGLLGFLREVTHRHRKRLVLKSPPHTARVRVLAELFPDARFVHIVRDPYAVFPSTVHLWKRLYRLHGLQKPNYEGLEKYVLDNFAKMYEAFSAQRGSIAPERLCEVRYEDLVADPVGQVERIYESLDLSDFDRVRPALEAYMARTKDYKTNRFELPDEQRAQIESRWASFFEQYGYEVQGSKTAAGQ